MDKKISAKLEVQALDNAPDWLKATLVEINSSCRVPPSYRKDTRELSGDETTVQTFREALQYKPKTKILEFPKFDLSSINSLFKTDIDCDEVYTRVFLGNALTAYNKEHLKKKKITHVLNAADGCVQTGADFYKDTPFEYLGCRMLDAPSENISQYFHKAVDFIDEAVSKEGKVFVHCWVGMSRSATLVIAYLMIKKNKLACDAIRTVKLRRNIINPNMGFLRQLAELEELRRQRL